MRVLMSIGGPTVFETDTPADEILIGTANGVATLRRADGGWRETRRALQGKHVSNLVEDPETGRLFAGCHREGIYASDDGGRTWTHKDRGMDQINVYSMSACRGDDGVRLYAGTEPAFFFKDGAHGE